MKVGRGLSTYRGSFSLPTLQCKVKIRPPVAAKTVQAHRCAAFPPSLRSTVRRLRFSSVQVQHRARLGNETMVNRNSPVMRNKFTFFICLAPFLICSCRYELNDHLYDGWKDRQCYNQNEKYPAKFDLL